MNMSDTQVSSPTSSPTWPAGYYDDEIDLRVYIDVLRQRRLMVIGIPAVFVAVAAVLSFFFLPSVYEATTGLVIRKARTEVQFASNIRTEFNEDVQGKGVEARREALQALATSRAVAAQVIEHLGDQLPEGERRIDTLLDSINSERTGDLLTIQVQHTDPELAATLANTWVEVYSEYVNPLFSGVAQNPNTLNQEVEKAEQNYQEAEEALVQFLADNPIPRLEHEISDLQKRIDKHYTDLRWLDNLIDDVEALQAQLDQDVASTMPTTLGNSLAVVFLRARGFTASSGAQLDTQLQLDPAAWATSPADVTSWQRELDALLTVLTARRAELSQTVQSKKWEQQLLALQSELERYRARKEELSETRNLAWNTFTSLRRKYFEVKVATEAPDLQVSIAMHADVPEEPVRPRKALNMALAAALGVMAGVFGAFFLEFLEEE